MGMQSSQEDQLLAVLTPIVTELKALRKRVAEVEAKPVPESFVLTSEDPILKALREDLLKAGEVTAEVLAEIDDKANAILKLVPSETDLEKRIEGAINRLLESEQYANVGEVAILDEKLSLVSEDMNKQLSTQEGVLRAEIERLNSEVNSEVNRLVSKESADELITSRLDAFVETGLLAKSEEVFSIKKEIASVFNDIATLLDEIEHLHGKLNSLPSQTEIGDRVIAFLKDSRAEDMREVKRILEIS